MSGTSRARRSGVAFRGWGSGEGDAIVTGGVSLEEKGPTSSSESDLGLSGDILSIEDSLGLIFSILSAGAAGMWVSSLSLRWANEGVVCGVAVLALFRGIWCSSDDGE